MRNMSIEIVYKDGEYHWEMYDGPDGIDHLTGIGSSLGDVFEQIVKAQITNSMKYQ